jgi:inhibitor of cysteine peptidase
MATIEVTSAEAGTSIDADVGDTILLRLADKPTTGYRWEFEPLTGESMVLDDSGYEQSGGALGGGGVATWTLSVIAAGTTSIALKRWRPWEGEASVLDRFTLTVHAHS